MGRHAFLKVEPPLSLPPGGWEIDRLVEVQRAAADALGTSAAASRGPVPALGRSRAQSNARRNELASRRYVHTAGGSSSSSSSSSSSRNADEAAAARVEAALEEERLVLAQVQFAWRACLL
jgi:hypothetical protein